MHKLIILIGSIANTTAFSDDWPLFLRQAEAMPGLLREATMRVQSSLYGSSDIEMIHELYFESQNALHNALSSSHGQAAGAILQRITGGQMNLLIAEHKEDSIENLRSYRRESSDVDAE